MIEVTRTITFTADPVEWAAEFGITVDEALDHFRTHVDLYAEQAVLEGLVSLRKVGGTVDVGDS